MKPLALALPAVFLLTTCAAYRAQHYVAVPAAAPAHHAEAAEEAPEPPAAMSTDPFAQTQAVLISEIDKYREELRANGKYDCCVKPACRQCALTAGECHCREVISANGPCCGECTQAWVEGKGDTEGVDREQVLAHLGCIRELYEKPVPEGVTPPGQKKKP